MRFSVYSKLLIFVGIPFGISGLFVVEGSLYGCIEDGVLFV